MRILAAAGGGQPSAVFLTADDTTLDVGAAVVFLHRLGQFGRKAHGLRDFGRAAQLPQGGFEENIKAHKAGHWVARQAEAPSGHDLAEHEGFARFERDFVVMDAAHALHGLAHEVVIAHGYAAGGNQHVGLVDDFIQHFQHVFQPVGHLAEVDYVHRQGREPRHQHIAVAVVDAVGAAAGRARLEQFVAAGEYGHTQFAAHCNFSKAQGGQQHDVGLTQNPPGLQHGIARCDFFAAAADIAALGRVFFQTDHAVLQLHVFLNHDAGAAFGHHCAGHDAHAAIGRQAT